MYVCVCVFFFSLNFQKGENKKIKIEEKNYYFHWSHCIWYNMRSASLISFLSIFFLSHCIHEAMLPSFDRYIDETQEKKHLDCSSLYGYWVHCYQRHVYFIQQLNQNSKFLSESNCDVYYVINKYVHFNLFYSYFIFYELMNWWTDDIQFYIFIAIDKHFCFVKTFFFSFQVLATLRIYYLINSIVSKFQIHFLRSFFIHFLFLVVLLQTVFRPFVFYVWQPNNIKKIQWK